MVSVGCDTEVQKTCLKNTPWDAAKSFSDCKNRQRRCEEWNEDRANQPNHEEHHSVTRSEAILELSVQDQTNELTDNSRIR